MSNEFIKVTVIKKDEVGYVLSSGSSTFPSALQSYGPGSYSPILSSQTQSVYISGGEYTEYIKASEVQRISSSKEGNKIYTKSWGEMVIKETAEEILHQMHGKEFQNKMDKFLNE